MTGAPILRAALRSSVWRGALLASCFSAWASSGALAHADGYTAGLRAASLIAVGSRIAALQYALAEDEIPGAAWTDAARLAGYLRLHHANDERVVTLYPLAAYAAATRRMDEDAATGYPSGRSAPARRATAMAARGAPQLR